MKAANSQLNMVVTTGSKALAQKAFILFVNSAKNAILSKNRFCVALSRYIPPYFFEILAEDLRSKKLEWDKIHLFCVDECCAARRCRKNGLKSAFNILIEKNIMPPENIHRICSNNSNCAFVASIYEQTICNIVTTRINRIPQFDLIMLAMDSDAHIASLYPDTYTFFDTKDLVRPIYYMDNRHTRITFTNILLRAALRIAVLVSGADKAVMLKKVLTSSTDYVRFPVHTIWPILNRVTWLIDRNAARFLTEPIYRKSS
jgi:6-phosphogluconolactonase